LSPGQTRFGPDGKPIAAAPAAAGTGAAGARLSATAIDKVAGADTALASISRINELYPRYQAQLGPIAGRLSSAQQVTPFADEGYAEFAAEITTLKNSVIKAITGAQMSEPEAKRIMGQIPDTTNQPAVFKARLASTTRNLEMLKRRLIELSGGSVGDEAEAGAVAPSGELRVGPYVGRVKP
jgi:hypothetical protein